LQVVLLAGVLLLAGVSHARAQETNAPDANGPDASANTPVTRLRSGAKPPPVNMNVTVGQDGYARPGRTAPVRVVLDTTETPVTGRLELRGAGRLVTRMPVDLPRRAHKEYTLFATLPEGSYVAGPLGELVLYSGRSAIVHQTLAPADAGDHAIVLSCTGDGSGLQFLNQNGQPFRVAHRSPQDLPREWAGYEPADVVALNGRAWTQMNDDQRRAFRMWVEQGGRAILCGESTGEWRDAEGRTLAGVVPQDLRSAPELRCVAPWGGMPYRARSGGLLTVSGPLTVGSSALGVEAQRPLLVAKSALLGRVI
jgi:hypothetical protein